MKRQIAAVLFSLSIIAPQVHAGEVARWNRVMTAAAAAEQTDPLTESRVFAIVQTAIHDALNAIERRSEPYREGLTATSGALPEAAVAAAAHAALVELLPAHKADFEMEFANALEPMKDKRAAADGMRVGKQAAVRLLALRRDDGANRPIAQAAGSRPGEYRPTPPDFTPAWAAHWGKVKPFVLASSSQFRPVPPLVPASTRARAENEEVRAIGGKTSALRNAEQSEISRFWYENSPQGWNRIAREVVAARKLDEWQSARLFALLNLAMADGYIGGFEAKYRYNYWRPATAIRANGDASWLSDLDTPPVPDYPSTHTVLGASAAAVLARFFGTDMVSFSMTSGAPYAGITPHFWSFSEAAQENGASRILAGIHFPTAVRAGYVQGDLIGAWAYDHALKPVRAD